MPRLSGPKRRKKQQEIRDRRNKKSLEIEKKPKDKDKPKKEPKYGKGEVARELGGALSAAGKKISAAQEKARTSTQSMKDSNWKKRNEKRKGYRF